MSKIVMPQDWVRAIGKAASALRFEAANDEWLTEAAKKELLSIAETLAEIESNTVVQENRRPVVTKLYHDART